MSHEMRREIRKQNIEEKGRENEKKINELMKN